MVRYENQCCDCATDGYPCLGNLCSLRRVEVHYCDQCGDELDDIYDVDGEELCEECLKEMFRRNE